MDFIGGDFLSILSNVPELLMVDVEIYSYIFKCLTHVLFILFVFVDCIITCVDGLIISDKFPPYYLVILNGLVLANSYDPTGFTGSPNCRE